MNWTAIKAHKGFIRFVSLSDQVLFSAANFLLTVVIARFYSELDMAAYGIALAVAMTLQGIQRGAYVVQNTVVAPVLFRRRARFVLAQHFLMVGLMAGTVGAAMALTAIIWDKSPLLVPGLAAVLPITFLYFQLDFDRMLMVKFGRFFDSLVLSGLYLLMIGAFYVLAAMGHMTFMVMMAALGGGVLLKMLWPVTYVGGPEWKMGMRLFGRGLRRYLLSSVVGVAGYTGYSNFPIFILASLAAPIHSAVFAAVRSLMQPLLVIIRSLDIIDKNYFTSSGTSLADMRRSVLRLVTLYGGGALAMGTVLSLAAHPLVTFVYGQSYAPYSNLLMGWAAIFFMLAVSSPIETVIVKIGQLNRYNMLRIPAGLVGIGAAYLLCADMGAWGAIIATFAGWVVTVGCGLWIIRPVIAATDNKSA